MIQICYLCANEAAHRYDRLFESLDIDYTVYDIDKVKSLTTFIKQERTLVEKDFLLIDLTAASYKNNHILNAVQHLRAFVKAELIFIAEPSGETTQLFGYLASRFHAKHLIEMTGDTDTLIKQVKACILGENSPMVFTEHLARKGAEETIAATTPSPLEIPAGLVIHVSVAGAMSRCGTTTQAFTIYHMLAHYGFRPAILDSAGGMISQLWDFYSGEKHSGHVTISGINFCTEAGGAFNAYVEDVGVLTEWNAKRFCDADLSALVVATKPWELPIALPKIKYAQESRKGNELVLLANNTPHAEARELEAITGALLVTPYRPDIWSRDVEEEYSSHFLPKLKKICGMEQEFSLADVLARSGSEPAMAYESEPALCGGMD